MPLSNYSEQLEEMIRHFWGLISRRVGCSHVSADHSGDWPGRPRPLAGESRRQRLTASETEVAIFAARGSFPRQSHSSLLF